MVAARQSSSSRGAAPADGADWAERLEGQVDFVSRTLRRLGAKPGEVEDLLQEVFLIVCRRRADYDPSRPLRPWIAGIVLKVVQESRRRGWRERLEGFVDAPDQARSPEQQLATAQDRVVVMAALGRLPADQRMLLVMHEIEEVSVRDLADAMSVNLFTLYSRLKRARSTFAKEVRRASLVTGLAKVVDRRRSRSRLGALLASSAVALAGLVLVVFAQWPSWGGGRSLVRPVDRGLVGYWRFDERPGSASAHDSSAGANDCLLRRLDPREVWQEGALAGALGLTGRGWLECPHVAAIDRLTDEITIAAWVTRGTDLRDYRAVVARQKDAGREDELLFGFANGQLLFASHSWQGKVVRPLPAGLPPWFHVGVTRRSDGTTILFVNGAELGRETTAGRRLGSPGNALLIGGSLNGSDPHRTNHRFDGAVDELVIFDRALSAAEMAALAARRQPSPVR